MVTEERNGGTSQGAKGRSILQQITNCTPVGIRTGQHRRYRNIGFFGQFCRESRLLLCNAYAFCARCPLSSFVLEMPPSIYERMCELVTLVPGTGILEGSPPIITYELKVLTSKRSCLTMAINPA
jgi:hypothetical protein